MNGNLWRDFSSRPTMNRDSNYAANSVMMAETSDSGRMWKPRSGVVTATSTLTLLIFSSMTCFRTLSTSFVASLSVKDFGRRR